MSEEKITAINTTIGELQAAMESFLENAKLGFPHVKKGAFLARDARKLSSVIDKKLKVFRSQSVDLFKKDKKEIAE